MIKSRIFQASILVGTIIGAGIFALPYVFKAAGLATGLFYLLLGAVIYSAIHLMYAKVFAVTPGGHRFVGLARVHLGRWAGGLAVPMTILEGIFVLAIYMILSESFLNLVLPAAGLMEKALFFWFISTLSIFIGLKRIALLEFLITGGIIAIIFIIFLLGLPRFEAIGRLDFAANWVGFILPLAPVIFALSGRQAIPALVEYRPNDYQRPIIVGTLIPAIVYALFVLSVVALSGDVAPDSITGLVGNIPIWAVALIGVFGILSLWSSYITVGFDIFRSLHGDLNIFRWLSAAIVAAGPLLIYFFGSRNFIELVGITGGLFLSLEGLLIISMWLKVTKRKLSLPILLLAAIFVIALIYEIIKLIII